MSLKDVKSKSNAMPQCVLALKAFAALAVISCDDLLCVIWLLAGISCAISVSSGSSLHHHHHRQHLFPRTDQCRLEPALIWGIHIAEAAAGRPRGWHCRHLVMTTTAGVAQAQSHRVAAIARWWTLLWVLTEFNGVYNVSTALYVNLNFIIQQKWP